LSKAGIIVRSFSDTAALSARLFSTMGRLRIMRPMLGKLAWWLLGFGVVWVMVEKTLLVLAFIVGMSLKQGLVGFLSCLLIAQAPNHLKA